jgi:hypothetical protein
MRLDHVVYAAEPDGLDATAARLGETLGIPFREGGIHPQFGTVNRVLPLAGGHYLEVVAVLDHPAADKMPFGQAVRARTEAGGGWLGWVVAVSALAPVEERLGRQAYEGHRAKPDGSMLRWHQIGVTGMKNDPQLPFFIRWDVPAEEHPSVGADASVRLARLEIAGDPGRVSSWLGEPEQHPLDDVEVDWIAPHGTPGIVAAKFATPQGVVRI